MNRVAKVRNEQARAWICGELRHSWKFILPVQKRDESRQVFAVCGTCLEETWIELPPDGWERFLSDLANGKIK